MKANTAGMFTLKHPASPRTAEGADDADVVEIPMDELSEAVSVPTESRPRASTLAFFHGQTPPTPPASVPEPPAPRARKNTFERFNDEMAVLDGPLQEQDVEYYDEPQPRRWRVRAIGLALFAVSCGGYLAVSRHHAPVSAEAAPAPAPAPAAAVAAAPPPAAAVAAAPPPAAATPSPETEPAAKAAGAAGAPVEKPAAAPEVVAAAEPARAESHHRHASRHASKSHHHHRAHAARHGART
jgi:hypothetical protein